MLIHFASYLLKDIIHNNIQIRILYAIKKLYRENCDQNFLIWPYGMYYMRGWQNYECEAHDLLTLVSTLALLSPKLTHEGMLIFCMTAFYDI